MKKILLAIFLFGAVQATQAQDRFNEAAAFAAQHLCDCVNEVYADIDEDVRNAVVVMATMSETEANNYITGLDQELILRIAEQSTIMMDESKSREFDDCNQSMVDAIDEKYPEDYEAMGYTESDFMDRMFKSLGADEACSFTYFLLQIGMSMQEDNGDHAPNQSKDNGSSERQ